MDHRGSNLEYARIPTSLLVFGDREIIKVGKLQKLPSREHLIQSKCNQLSDCIAKMSSQVTDFTGARTRPCPINNGSAGMCKILPLSGDSIPTLSHLVLKTQALGSAPYIHSRFQLLALSSPGFCRMPRSTAAWATQQRFNWRCPTPQGLRPESMSSNVPTFTMFTTFLS